MHHVPGRLRQATAGARGALQAVGPRDGVILERLDRSCEQSEPEEMNIERDQLLPDTIKSLQRRRYLEVACLARRQRQQLNRSCGP